VGKEKLPSYNKGQQSRKLSSRWLGGHTFHPLSFVLNASGSFRKCYLLRQSVEKVVIILI
jgi:hypothetical protein